MNISLSELRQFLDLSSPIVGHNTLPVLGYVKMGGGKIIKSVLSSFVQYECNEADTEMLVDEKLLTVKISNAQSGFLNIIQKLNKVTITDSVTPTTFQVPDIKTFPVIPEATSERYAISENFMRVLEKAQKFPLKPDPVNLSWMSFIMIGNGHMCASDGHGFFMEPIDEEFELVLHKQHAQIISKMPIKAFAFAEKYLFFYTDNATIGFSKQEIGYSNIIKYGDVNGSPMEFSASASDLQRFNKECTQSSRSPFVAMTDGKLAMNDADMDVLLERTFEGIKPSKPFTYNAETMNRVLSAVDGNEVEFYRGKDWYWLKCPPQKSTLLIMRLLD